MEETNAQQGDALANTTSGSIKKRSGDRESEIEDRMDRKSPTFLETGRVTPRRDERPTFSPRTKHNTRKIGEARCHRAFEQPPPTHTPPRSMRRGKKGSNKKGKVRTAHARPRGGRPHRVTAIHGPADVYFRFVCVQGSAVQKVPLLVLPVTLCHTDPVHPRMSRYH